MVNWPANLISMILYQLTSSDTPELELAVVSRLERDMAIVAVYRTSGHFIAGASEVSESSGLDSS